MPFVNVKIIKGQIEQQQKLKLVEGLTDLIVNIMKRDRNFTVITIDELDDSQWAIGGRMISQFSTERIVTFVNIKVSKGTTNPEEINEMMSAAKKLMIELFGNSDECNYFIIDELNPDAWGFDGLSMTERRKLG